MTAWNVGDWCWHARQASPCRIVDRQDVLGEVFFRVWLPAKDAVVRARAQDLGALTSVARLRPGHMGGGFLPGYWRKHRGWPLNERKRARCAFKARYQAISWIGLLAVGEHRRKRLEAEHEARLAALAIATACTPDLYAMLMLRVGQGDAPA